jgi:hypothetical protein
MGEKQEKTYARHILVVLLLHLSSLFPFPNHQ